LPPIAFPLLGGGGELVGSEKLGTPWARMHFASESNWSLRLCEAPGEPVGGCANRPHARSAALNAGESVLMLLGITSPPVARGSGKVGTPCARMHCAYFSSGPPLAAAPPGMLALPPQAASNTPQIKALRTV